MTNPVMLNIGAGGQPMEGWINCDLYAGHHIDFVFDAQETWPFEDHSVDGIFSSHALEHLAKPVNFFREAQRVLKSNGEMQIRVPSGNSTLAMSDVTHMRPWYPASFLCFTNTYAKDTFNPQHTHDWPDQFKIVSIGCNMGPFWKQWFIPQWLKLWATENVLNSCRELVVCMRRLPWPSASTEALGG